MSHSDERRLSLIQFQFSKQKLGELIKARGETKKLLNGMIAESFVLTDAKVKAMRLGLPWARHAGERRVLNNQGDRR